jgi:hypothetical protein
MAKPMMVEKTKNILGLSEMEIKIGPTIPVAIWSYKK